MAGVAAAGDRFADGVRGVGGPMFGRIKPSEDLGALLNPIIKLGVAVILFEGGLTLRFHEFRQAATKDQKTVILTAYATWRIADATKFLKAVGQEDTATRIIRDLLENQVQLVLRDHNLEELVNVDPKKMKLEQIERMTLLGGGGETAGVRPQ